VACIIRQKAPCGVHESSYKAIAYRIEGRPRREEPDTSGNVRGKA
jgi:hypothetical protein